MRRSSSPSPPRVRAVDSPQSTDWGKVHVETATMIRAPAEQLVALCLDYARWPQLFPATIRATRLVGREGSATIVEVDHRTAGLVINVIRPRPAHAIELKERKPKYEATFINRFEPVDGGTRYTVNADIRLTMPYALLAPFLRAYVRRSVRRYVLEPMRHAAERGPDASRRV